MSSLKNSTQDQPSETGQAGTARKRAKATSKTKAKPTRRIFWQLKSPRYSECWMKLWLRDAEALGSLVEACAVRGVTLSLVYDACRRDPVFAASFRQLLRTLDARIIDSIQAAAVAGEVRAQALYFGHVRKLIHPADGPGPDGPPDLPPAVIEEMIRVGLAGITNRGPVLDGDPPPAPPQDDPIRLSLPAPA